jgi:hypothetical protein
VLQKFAQYRIPLAIVGDFSKFESKSLNNFIYESHKGKQINFVSSLSGGLKALTFGYWKPETSNNPNTQSPTPFFQSC